MPPPPLSLDDARHPSSDRRYAVHGVPASELPATESLKETVARVLPAWQSEIVPALSAGKRVLLVAHGNSLRALVKNIDGISNEDIVSLNIPTGVPLVYEFDAAFKPIRHPNAVGPLSGRYVGDKDAIAAEVAKVAAQSKAKK